MNRKPARIAVAVLFGILSVVGLSQAPTGAASAAKTGPSWCC